MSLLNRLMKLFFYVLLLYLAFYIIPATLYSADHNFSTAIDPQEYIIGPGDNFRIDFWDGSTEVIELTVTPEGTVLLTSMGMIRVSDLTLTEAKKRIRELIRRYYSDADFSVSLTGVRQLQVLVTGAVKRPGLYDVFASQRVSELINLAGGLLPGACQRGIKLSGQNGQSHNADLLLFERTGNLKSNPYIFSGHKIEVPFIKDSSTFIQVSGEVVRPGGVEFMEGDNLAIILNLAVGFSGLENDSILIFRKDEESYREIVIPNSKSDYSIKPGDKIIVLKKEELVTTDYYSISGEIRRPGRYPYVKGMSLADAVQKAGEVSDGADIRSTAIFRKPGFDLPPTMIRTLSAANPNALELTTVPEPISIGVKIEDKQSMQRIALKPGDSIVIPLLSGSVGIYGLVNRPGVVDFSRVGAISGFIKLAGGFAPTADRKAIQVVRKSTGATIITNPRASIYDGDRIIVLEDKRRKETWDKIKDISLILAGLGITYLAIDNIAD